MCRLNEAKNGGATLGPPWSVRHFTDLKTSEGGGHNSAPACTRPNPLYLPIMSSSALHSNIQEKGENSYYYAHANTSKAAHVTTLGDTPRLVSSGGGKEAPAPAIKASVATYQWADDEGEVIIYVPLATTLEDTAPPELTLDFTASSLSLKIKQGGGRSESHLLLKALHSEITAATCKWLSKSKKVLVKLTKKEPGAWYKIGKDDRPFEGDE